MIGFRQMDRPKKSLKFDPDFPPSLKYGTEGGGAAVTAVKLKKCFPYLT